MLQLNAMTEMKKNIEIVIIIHINWNGFCDRISKFCQQKFQYVNLTEIQ